MKKTESETSQDSISSVTVYFDGECPFCSREVKWLSSRIENSSYSFCDIKNFKEDASRPELNKAALMKEIHAVNSKGEVVKGMAVFRLLYKEANLGWLVKPTGWPVLKNLFDLGYKLFARYRVSLGRLFSR